MAALLSIFIFARHRDSIIMCFRQYRNLKGAPDPCLVRSTPKKLVTSLYSSRNKQ